MCHYWVLVCPACPISTWTLPKMSTRVIVSVACVAAHATMKHISLFPLTKSGGFYLSGLSQSCVLSRLNVVDRIARQHPKTSGLRRSFSGAWNNCTPLIWVCSHRLQLFRYIHSCHLFRWVFNTFVITIPKGGAKYGCNNYKPLQLWMCANAPHLMNIHGHVWWNFKCILLRTHIQSDVHGTMSPVSETVHLSDAHGVCEEFYTTQM